MKKLKKILFIVLIALLILLPLKVVIADSGFDSDFDSGGGSSSWDSSSSSSSWDSDSGGSSRHSGSSSRGDMIFCLLIVIMIIIALIRGVPKAINSKSTSVPLKYRKMSDAEIQNIDPLLSNETIVDKTFELYRDLQYAWMEFDNDKIRTLVSDELFNTYKMQLETLKRNGQKNIMENICKISGFVVSLRKNGNIETCDVVLNITMKDYLVNKYNAVVRGNTSVKGIAYLITIDKVVDEAKRATNCPSCGNALTGDASQKCPYCGADIVVESSDFIISKKMCIGQGGYDYCCNPTNDDSVKEINISHFDNSIDNSMFKTKVDNIFVQLYTGLSNGDLKDVKHKISKEVYDMYQVEVDKNNKNNVKRLFDELNVKSTEILEIKDVSDRFIVKVKLVSRYMDYYVNKDTNEFVSGNNKSRDEHINTLILEKRKNTKEITSVLYCPGCGKPANVNESGNCIYCGETFNMDDYDYILTDINIK